MVYAMKISSKDIYVCLYIYKFSMYNIFFQKLASPCRSRGWWLVLYKVICIIDIFRMFRNTRFVSFLWKKWIQKCEKEEKEMTFKVFSPRWAGPILRLLVARLHIVSRQARHRRALVFAGSQSVIPL